MRWLTATLLVLALCPASAGAVQLVNPDGSVAQPYQTWADASQVPTPDLTLTVAVVKTVDCPNPYFIGEVLGCADSATNTLWLHVRGCTPRSYFRFTSCRFRLGHELGHFFDNMAMSDAKRAAFQQIIGRGRGWSDYEHLGAFEEPPGEIFADAYSMCMTGRKLPAYSAPGRLGGSSNSVVFHASTLQFQSVCDLIRQ